MIKYRTLSGIALVALFLGAVRVSQASAVGLGSDYLASIPGASTFPGLGTLNGVPLGPATGNTNIIVRRQADAIFPGAPPATAPAIPSVLSSLQLVTTTPVNFAGNGLDNYFVTLQSARGGPDSVGGMTITLGALDDGTAANPEGTFSSFFDVFFDIRKSSLAGPIVFSSDLVLTNSGPSWDATNPTGAFIVTGLVGNQNANLHTNKLSTQMDFFPVGTFSSFFPNGAVFTTQQASAAVPEPATMSLALIGLGFAGIAGVRRRRRVA
jgi:hypothetical protein